MSGIKVNTGGKTNLKCVSLETSTSYAIPEGVDEIYMINGVPYYYFMERHEKKWTSDCKPHTVTYTVGFKPLEKIVDGKETKQKKKINK